MSRMVERITHLLNEHGRQWKVEGKLIDPTAEMVEETIDHMAKILYNEADGATAITGGLLMLKDNTQYSVYLYIGDTDGG